MSYVRRFCGYGGGHIEFLVVFVTTVIGLNGSFKWALRIMDLMGRSVSLFS